MGDVSATGRIPLFLLFKLETRPIELQEAIFTRFFESAEIAKLDKVELSQYEESLKNFRDWNSVIKTAEMKGEARGEAKGRAEGKIEGKIEMAKKMKFLGISIEIIIESSGLSREEVDEL